MQQDARQAQQSLDQAQRRMESALKESQQAFRDERISRLRQTVSEFISRQQRFLDETLRVDSQRPASSETMTPQVAQALQSLGTEQALLSEEVAEVATTIMDAEAFAFALQEVAQFMASAGQTLMNSVSGEQTASLQRQATTGLQQVLTALMDDVPRPSPGEQPQPPNTPQEEEQEQGPTKYLFAQLKLIRALQERVNQQTAALDQESKPWDQVRLGRQQNLVRQQRRLAELIMRLLDTVEEKPKPIMVRPPTSGLDALDEALEQDSRK